MVNKPEWNDSLKKYLIALDDGHGMDTPGKQTPTFSDGSFMKENEFNRVVVNYHDIELKRCGFDTLLVAPTDEDTPLSMRVNTANNANANVYISIHANAYDSSFGGRNPEGVETFCFEGSSNGKKLATKVHNQLITGTKHVNRGIKRGNHLYVIRRTRMPAILVEAGFMDNPRETKLLQLDDFRKEVAREICIGICSYFEVPYILESDNLNIEE